MVRRSDRYLITGQERERRDSSLSRSARWGNHRLSKPTVARLTDYRVHGRHSRIVFVFTKNVGPVGLPKPSSKTDQSDHRATCAQKQIGLVVAVVGARNQQCGPTGCDNRS